MGQQNACVTGVTDGVCLLAVVAAEGLSSAHIGGSKRNALVQLGYMYGPVCTQLEWWDACIVVTGVSEWVCLLAAVRQCVLLGS